VDTTFSPQLRILMCASCGAPTEAALAGGQTACRYCRAVNHLDVRDERPVFGDLAQQPQIPEPERIARLRAQDGRPLLPPAGIASLVPGGRIEPWKVQEVLAVWQQTRQELKGSGNFEAAERLLYLTMILANQFSEQNDFLRQRAMFESALDVFKLPRHRQVMRGYLSRAAARIGDLAAAEQWLAPCNPRSDDLESDSAYRVSRAMLDTTKHNYQAVLQVLGARNEDVPVMDAWDPAAAVFRANAWEKTGNLPAAIDVLNGAMRAGASSRMAIQKVIELTPGLQLCPQSFPQAQGQHAAVAGRVAATQASGGIHKVFIPLGVLFLVGALACVVVAIVSQFVDMGFAVGITTGSIGVTFIPLGGVFLGIGVWMKKAADRAQRIRVHGISGTGRVTGVAPTGLAINNVPQIRIDLSIQLPGRAPYAASTKMLGGMQLMMVMRPGAEVPVRVDPQDLAQVLIELQ
jgi:hypothetical protein